MKVIGTGLSGLVGSRVVELLSGDFDFFNLSLETGFDITRKKAIHQFIVESDAHWIFHFAAATDVDKCEKEKVLKEKSQSWKVNVEATQNIVDAVRQTKKRMLYISTDYVFEGSKDYYSEDDEPNPQGWYGRTKYEGELRVAELNKSGLIVRIANPYRAKKNLKPDFVGKILENLRSDRTIKAPVDQIFVPTLIDDLAWAIKALVLGGANGIYHAVGAQALSPYNAALKVAVVFALPTKLIKKTTFIEYFQGRAPRPFHADLKHDKITKLGIWMTLFDQGLERVRSQQNNE